MDAHGGKTNQNTNIRNKMKEPTELEVELHKLLLEAIEGLFDAGQESMAKHILKEMGQAVKKSKQTK
jgi:hypothetical protein